MKTPDKVAMLLEASEKDESKTAEVLRALLEQVMWFPIEYHPELGDPYEPTPDRVIPVWIGGDARGAFIPVFSSPKMMRIGLQRFTKKHSRARMNGRSLMAYLATRNYNVRVNPGCGATAHIPADSLAKLAASNDEDLMNRRVYGKSMFKPLPPDAWPAEHAGLLAEACEKEDGLVAVWLADLSQGAEELDAGALYILVWLRDIEHTPFHNLKRAIQVAFPDKKVEYVRMDEAHHGSIDAMRQFPPVWPRAL